jgi:hypothetical protein
LSRIENFSAQVFFEGRTVAAYLRSAAAVGGKHWKENIGRAAGENPVRFGFKSRCTASQMDQKK